MLSMNSSLILSDIYHKEFLLFLRVIMFYLKTTKLKKKKIKSKVYAKSSSMKKQKFSLFLAILIYVTFT